MPFKAIFIFFNSKSQEFRMNIVNCELFDLFHFSTIHSFCCKYQLKIPHVIDMWYLIN